MSSIDDSNIALTLWRHAERAAERPAVVERARAATYGEVRRAAGSLCHHLRSLGVRPGDRVAMLLERGIDAVASYYGTLASGAIVVVINERLRPRQIEHVLRHSDARILLTKAPLLASQPRALDTTANVIAIESLHAGEDAAPCPRIGPDIAQIIFTSGSTGLPKGVALTHGNLGAGALTVATYLGLSRKDRIASLLPFSSVYGVNQLLCAMTSAAALVIELSTLPADIDAGMRAAETSVIAAVPALWTQLLRVRRFAEEPMPSLRVLQNAGGHLPVDIVRRLRRAQPHARLFLQYGLTETFRSTFLPPDEVDTHLDSIGRSVPGAEMQVLRDDCTACEDGEIGELVHRGPTVAAGYWNEPESTERVFRANPLRPAGAPASERVVFSGDLVRRDADGFLYFVGRRDHMIKTLGYRIGPDEVSDVLVSSGEVFEAVVTGEPDGQRGERIVAWVVLSPNGALDRLKEYCRRELPRHLQPARYELQTVLPRLGGGKYDLVTLRAQRLDADPPSIALEVPGAETARSGAGSTAMQEIPLTMPDALPPQGQLG
jgi:amino acid adenylation domain-containing protein